MRLALGVGGVSLAILTGSPAAADPPPPDPLLVAVAAADTPAPAPVGDPPPAGPAPITMAPSAAQQTTSNPLAAFTNLLAGPSEGVPPNPAVPQSGPTPNPLSSIGLLMPQNFGMPTGEQTSPYVLGQNTPSGLDRIDAYQGIHALIHQALGRMPRDQLGQPLPGTAPPPGTAIPPGLVQYLPEPATSPAPADPAAPAIPPPLLPVPAG